MGIEIRDERDGHGRYTVYRDGYAVGYAAWVLVGDKTVVLPHAEVDPAYRDQGIGSLLARRAFDDARAEQHTVIPQCAFMRRWAQLHPAYADIVRTPRPGSAASVGAVLAAARTLRALEEIEHPHPHPKPWQ